MTRRRKAEPIEEVLGEIAENEAADPTFYAEPRVLPKADPAPAPRPIVVTDSQAARKQARTEAEWHEHASEAVGMAIAAGERHVDIPGIGRIDIQPGESPVEAVDRFWAEHYGNGMVGLP